MKHPLQVYEAMWHQMPVAVKQLLNTGLGLEAGAADEQTFSLSHPLLNNLRKVRREGGVRCGAEQNRDPMTSIGVDRNMPGRVAR